MRLTDLTEKEISDENMAWVYKAIKKAYENGYDEVVLKDTELTEKQFFHLREVKGYTMNSQGGNDYISGW
ncbi:hypothetical protein VP496E541_P0096 [Vibrio phage 496E54-1]|nr:hypothetical protein VP495E541_P0095 [Vibrio phage 495E54-1]CAH9013485.1 hypothetical protein VP496E541_P0096 [Vibrio phage 496E54-1]